MSKFVAEGADVSIECMARRLDGARTLILSSELALLLLLLISKC